MPTNTRREKMAHLNNVLLICHNNQIDHRTPALADRIAGMLRPLGFGKLTEKEYVRLIVDALFTEAKTGKEFHFADA
jgi:hypothetical protein